MIQWCMDDGRERSEFKGFLKTSRCKKLNPTSLALTGLILPPLDANRVVGVSPANPVRTRSGLPGTGTEEVTQIESNRKEVSDAILEMNGEHTEA